VRTAKPHSERLLTARQQQTFVSCSEGFATTLESRQACCSKARYFELAVPDNAATLVGQIVSTSWLCLYLCFNGEQARKAGYMQQQHQ
jgi:hypothetical protein